MNATSGTILLTLLVGVLFAPRRWALLAILVGVFFLTQGHAVNLAGLAIFPIRFLAVAAFARVLLRREFTWSQLNKIDWAVLIAYNYSALVWILRSQETAAEQFAFAIDPTVCYLALRGLVAKVEDLRWLLRAFAPLLVPFTALVVLERVTGQTSFDLVGANWQLYVREGITRSSGAFRHASLLGSVAAAFLALYVGLWGRHDDRKYAALGGTLCAALIVLSNSGGPLTSALVAMAGWLLWPLRDRMHVVRRVLLAVLVLLIVFMKAPIWYLPFKVSAIVGGGGYHRGLLMESAWNDLGRWWLVGMDLRETLPWIPYEHGLTGGVDITNEFIVFGLKGGLASVLLLILVLRLAFNGVGRKLQAIRHDRSELATVALLWGLGVALIVHTISWLGIAYFDQSWVVWLLHLATVSASLERSRIEGTAEPRIELSSRRRPVLAPVRSPAPVAFTWTRQRGTIVGDVTRPALLGARKEMQ
jgi:hypothetical protein